ncbi:UNVERIFIED_CONTAM: hypothetical protein Sindi_2110400 [Sesamum indicum]
MAFTWHNRNHFPLVLQGKASRTVARVFKFDNYLAKSPCFLALVGEAQELLLLRFKHHPLLLQLESCYRMVYTKAVKLEQDMLQNGLRYNGSEKVTIAPKSSLEREEAQSLIRPMQNEEVNEAVFNIVEDKSPKPDGYSAGFFKVTGLIIGEEVTAPILEFFNKGQLLNQVNATYSPLSLKGRCLHL